MTSRPFPPGHLQEDETSGEAINNQLPTLFQLFPILFLSLVQQSSKLFQVCSDRAPDYDARIGSPCCYEKRSKPEFVSLNTSVESKLRLPVSL